jgi:two-component system, OmpR family, KDP operon response regulator KdpE
MSMGRIIIASKADRSRRDLRTALESEGHSVVEALTAGQAIAETRDTTCDVLIVDSDITDSSIDNIDLYAFCRDVRTHSALGIIVLIRDDAEQSRIDALNAGADDYLSGHFSSAELLARVRAILRRIHILSETRTKIALHDRAIDLASRKVEGPGDRIAPLTPKEFLVLQRLIGADKPVTNQDLARSVWGRDESGTYEYVRMVISQLRRKLEADCTRPRYILTERLVGYRFTIPPAGQPSPCRIDSQARVL